MTNLDTLRALVELGEKPPADQLRSELTGARLLLALKDGLPDILAKVVAREGAHDNGATMRGEQRDDYFAFFAAAANARPALAALIAEFEKAVGLLGEAAPMLASKWVTVEECKAVAARISAFLAACAGDSETGRLENKRDS